MKAFHSSLAFALFSLILSPGCSPSRPGAEAKPARNVPARGEETRAPRVRPCILSAYRAESGWWTSGVHHELIAKPLSQEGFEVDACEEVKIPEALATGKYSVLVYASMWDVSGPDEVKRYREQFDPIQKAINAFLAKGGGLLIPGTYHQGALVPAAALTEPWGARMLPERTVDSAGEKDLLVKWAYTTQVSGPAAPGVRGVWFPTGSDEAGKWCWPLEVNTNWTVVVRGEKTTTCQFSHWSADVDVLKRKEPVTGGVPLAAVRTLGAGRVALFGVPNTYSFLAVNFPGADAFLYEGIEGKPSDGRKLIVNLLRWLSEPAVKAGLCGGTTPEHLFKPHIAMHVSAPPPVKWDAEMGPFGKPYRGLAGARTVLSTGKSTVADYAKAARAAGVDFIVFLEDHKAMTPEKNAQLRKECSAVSDEKFQAIPGFTIEDEFGNGWFMVGEKATYPDPVYLSADRQILAAKYKDERRTRTMGMLMCDLMLGQYQAHVTVGSWNHKRAAMPPWDFRDYCAAAVVMTSESGQLEDDIWKEYLKIQENGTLVTPFAFEMMNSAEQVAERARTGYLNYVWVTPLAAAAQRVGSYRNDQLDQYISNGPEILDWQATPCFYPGLIGDRFRPDLCRMRVRIQVRSANGLKLVEVFDGTRLIRRFSPGGEKTFKRDLELFNIPQQNLLLNVVDQEGRRALSKTITTRCGDFVEFMCSDRNNQIFNGYGVREDGSVFREAPPTGNGATPDKGTPVWLITPCFPHVYDFRSPACPWDGGRFPAGSCMRFVPRVDIEGDPEKPLHNTPRRALHSQDVMIGEAVIDGAFNPKYLDFIGMVWQSLFPKEESRYLAGGMRLTYWKTRPDSYTATFFESTIRFKKDVTLKGDLPIVLGQMVANPKTEFVLREAGGEVRNGHAKTAAPLKGSIGETGYVSYYENNANASFFPLSPGVQFAMNGGLVQLGYRPESPRIEAGTEFKFKVLGVGTPLVRDPEAARKVDEAFGITTGRPAYTVKLERGKVASQRYVLALEADGPGATGMIPKKELPAYLPVMVSKLNPLWTVIHLNRATGKWRPVGIEDDTAYVILNPTADEENFFIGHPATCDRPELRLQLTQTNASQWLLEIHNPTDREIEGQVGFAREFTPLQGDPVKVKVGPGQSQAVSLSSAVAVAEN
jgi:hypothetical protein